MRRAMTLGTVLLVGCASQLRAQRRWIATARAQTTSDCIICEDPGRLDAQANDRDDDGYLDVDDACPEEAEDFDAIDDHDGCPD